MRWQENTRLMIAVSSGISVAVGAGVGYVLASKMLEKSFQERLEAEIQDARSFYQDMYSTPVFVAEEKEEVFESIREATDAHDGPPQDLVGQALSAMATYDPEGEEAREEERARHQPVIVNNIFANTVPPGEEVLGALMADRDPAKPYIITREEFLQGRDEFEQVEYTYWEGDDILVDDRYEFQPIENMELVAGEENLLRFGYGSGDENVLYIRNEAMDPPLDLHITKSSGKYAVEVMAVGSEDDHLEHSEPRKFRPYHDG
jgi:NTP pyrophosphatase (non-canonical NTP hydrolase)